MRLPMGIDFTSIIMIYSCLKGTPCDGTYEPSLHNSIVYEPRTQSVVLGDFNQDKILDIAAANTGSDSMGIFLGYGHGKFSSQTIYFTGKRSLPYSVNVADFNNDNRLDIIATNFGTHNVGIFLGRGDGTFFNQSTYSTGSSRPMTSAVADFDGDKRLDIVITNYGTESIGILMGRSDGTFSSPIILTTGYDSFPRSIAVGDFNNDGRMDVAVANFGTSNIGLFFGSGDGTFLNQSIYSTGVFGPIAIAVADLNHDNRLDIVVANYAAGNVRLLLGDTNGTLQSISTIFSRPNSMPSAIVICDFNNDRLLDIGFTNAGTDNLTVLLGQGDGQFYSEKLYSTGPRSTPLSIACGDLNNDNQMDIVVANPGTNSVGVLLGYDTGAFTPAQSIYSNPFYSPYFVAIGDFNNDGQLDIAAANSDSNTVDIILGYAGTFAQPTMCSTNSSRPISIAVGDFNMDKYLDLVVANYDSSNIGILIGYGNGTFAREVTYSTDPNSAPVSVAVADFNNDTYLDFAVANFGSGSIGVFLGNGDGSFTNQIKYSTGNDSAPQSITIDDFNEDNHLDIVVANSRTNTIGILFGFGNGTFQNQVIYPTGPGTSPYSVATGDFNQDTHVDLVVTYFDANQFCILLGFGNGTFQVQTPYPTGKFSKPYFVTVADFNKDNCLDVAIANTFTHEVLILFGYGNGTFPLEGRSLTGPATFPKSIAIGDFDNNSRFDIVVAHNGNGGILIYFGYDDTSFQTQMTSSTGQSPAPSSIAFGDFNGDNRPDMVITNSGANHIEILFGFGNGTFTNQTAYTTGTNSGPHFVTVCDINNDTRQDIIVINTDSNNVGVFLGIGNGTFIPETMHSTGFASQPYSVAVGDFNKDQKIDLAVTNFGTNTVAIFIRYNTGRFSVQKKLPTSSLPISVAVGDFNNDNRTDIVVVSWGGDSVGVRLGHGDGTFADEIQYALPFLSSPNSIAVGDFNNDDQLDVVIANQQGDSVTVLLGSGFGTFPMNATYNLEMYTGPIAVAVGDLNDDTWLDIVIVNYYANNINVLFGTGKGTFDNLATYSVQTSRLPAAVAIADFNKDKKLDIVVAYNLSGNVDVLLGYGNGTFAKQLTYATGQGSYPQSIAFADVNNDTHLDLIIANSGTKNVGILYGFGNGTFQSQVTHPTGSDTGPTFVAVGDFNNDNRPDIAITKRYTAKIVVLLGYATGFAATEIEYPTDVGSEPCFLAIADFNNDNRQDIVVSNYGTANVGVFLGDSLESFLTPWIYPTGSNSRPYSVAVGDFNKDSQLDLAVVNAGADNIGIFLGYQYGYFGIQKQYSTGNNSNPRSIAVADFDNDARLDLAVANYGANNIGILLGDGNGSFVSQRTYSTGSGSHPHSVAVGDFDNDTHVDIAVANAGSSDIVIFYGHGNGTFTKGMSFSLGYGTRPISIAIADVHNDNWLDIAIANYASGNVEVLVKTCL